MEIELRRAVGLLDYLGKQAWLKGEEIFITNRGKPYLKLVAHPDGDPIQKRTGLGRLDQIKGDAWIASDLPETTEDIIEAFEGKYSNDEHLFEGYLVQPDPDEGRVDED